MDYYESAEGEVINSRRAQREVEAHGLDFDEMLDELGIKPTYKAQDVLDWLGY
tara:strand:+ start:43 stop:201 length:159 start_codon:yes stop_codon:yes gene_type:complete